MQLDETIDKVETLYHQLTGQSAPQHESIYAPIPPEADASTHVQEQLRRLVDLVQQPPPTATAWTPAVAIVDADDDLVVSFDLAGIPRELIEVSATRDTLTVRGQRQVPGDRGVRLAEMPTGRFERHVLLPANAAVDRARARFRDGLLEVRVPKLPEPKQHRAIPIE